MIPGIYGVIYCCWLQINTINDIHCQCCWPRLHLMRQNSPNRYISSIAVDPHSRSYSAFQVQQSHRVDLSYPGEKALGSLHIEEGRLSFSNLDLFILRGLMATLQPIRSRNWPGIKTLYWNIYRDKFNSVHLGSKSYLVFKTSTYVTKYSFRNFSQNLT